MYFQIRGGKFSFVYFDSSLGKNVRLPQKRTPFIKDRAEAERFCKIWEAQFDSEKERIQKRLEWRDRYHGFKDLLEIYERTRKEQAPNSWSDNMACMNYYILPFFLDVQKENNLNNWHWHFESFRDYLETAVSVRRSKNNIRSKLAYSSKNNVISALNAFIMMLYRRRIIDKAHKCRQFENSKLNSRTETSVIEPDIAQFISSALEKENPLMADFFNVSLRTGMRINEVAGLSLADFFAGEIESKLLQTALEPYRLKALGYIALDSQPVDRFKPRCARGKVMRKPLKGKKRIDSEHSRIIPIFEPETYQRLVSLWNQQQKAFQERAYGGDPKDYLLFDPVVIRNYYRVLRKVQKSLNLKKIHSPHDCRHTYSTWLAETTGGNYALCRLILGHSELEVTMRYVHVNAGLLRQLKISDQLGRQILPD